MERKKSLVSVFVVLYSLMFVMKGNSVVRNLFSITSEQFVLFQFVLYLSLCLLGIAAYRKELGEKWQWVTEHKIETICIIVVSFVVTSLADIIFSFLVSSLASVLNVDFAFSNENNVVQVLAHFPPIITILVLGVVGPVVEELFFRQFLVGTLSDRYSRTVAVVVSAILFALNHAQRFQVSELLAVCLHLPTGIVWGILFLRTNKNIYFTSCLHIFNNLMVFLL